KDVFSNWSKPPGPGFGQQSSLGNETHQLWCDKVPAPVGPLPDPLVYKIDVRVATHRFTSSNVLPINAKGQSTGAFDVNARPIRVDSVKGVPLPLSTIYGFNGTFPGPRINAEYGKPVLVRFENHLDENPLNLDRQDLRSPGYPFLTPLHSR